MRMGDLAGGGDLRICPDSITHCMLTLQVQVSVTAWEDITEKQIQTVLNVHIR